MIRDLKDSEKKLVDILDDMNAGEGSHLHENQVTNSYMNQCVFYTYTLSDVFTYYCNIGYEC